MNSKQKGRADEKSARLTVQYGKGLTYLFELDAERLGRLVDKTNRSYAQTQFLFQLVGGDFENLKALEIQIKNCFLAYCPTYFEEVEKIMALEPKSNWFTLAE